MNNWTESGYARLAINSRVVGDCVEWTGQKDRKGYGLIRVGSLKDGTRRFTRTHRLSYELNISSVPDGMLVCHRCDNPACIRPDHLFIGSAADNNADMRAKGRQAHGSRNGASKLTETDVATIRSSYKSGGVLQRELAARFCVSQKTISDIVRGKNWKPRILRAGRQR